MKRNGKKSKEVQEINEEPPLEKSASNKDKRIVDRLDLQLLVAVIVFFVSSWAYLDNIICDFTTTEPHNERMAYILVHYFLSLMLVLCIAITYIKGKYILKTDDDEVGDAEKRYITLFIDCWFWVLILCILVLVFNKYFWGIEYFWGIGMIVFCILLIIYFIRKKFPLWESIACIALIVLLFPLFISIMTNISKNVDINVSYNREIETLSIEVDARSYDCRYFIKGLTDEELILGKDYDVVGPVIIIRKAYLRNNMVTVSTICPASGSEFINYSIRKILGYEDDVYIPENPSIYNKTKIISIE